MSFLEIDPLKFDVITDIEAVPVETAVTRLAWRILTTFGAPETVEVEVEVAPEHTAVEAFGVLSTPVIDPLKKGRCIYLDQLPVVDDEPCPEPGLMTLKVSNPAKDDKVERQIIFRLETHPKGAAVFYETTADEDRVTDEIELEILRVKLDITERMYWHVVKNLGQATMIQLMPLSEIHAQFSELLQAPND